MQFLTNEEKQPKMIEKGQTAWKLVDKWTKTLVNRGKLEFIFFLWKEETKITMNEKGTGVGGKYVELGLGRVRRRVYLKIKLELGNSCLDPKRGS